MPLVVHGLEQILRVAVVVGAELSHHPIIGGEDG